MPKFTREDWEKLRNHYHVAFQKWPDAAFNSLLDTVYGSQTHTATNPGGPDDTDALMVCAAHAEPPIPPAKS